jgi:hypothetical protein
MTKWLVIYWPCRDFDLAGREALAGREFPSFRIFPEDDPESWIAQTNPDLPREVQEAALLIAEALSKILGA